MTFLAVTQLQGPAEQVTYINLAHIVTIRSAPNERYARAIIDLSTGDRTFVKETPDELHRQLVEGAR